MASKDYTQDGLLYCGACNKPKQMRINVFSDEHIVSVMCDCEVEEKEKERREWEDKQEEIRISNLRVNSIQDRERRKCRFESAEMTANLEKCQKYVNNWEEMRKNNIGLLMWGTCGNGKSFAAACIANALTDKGIPTMMTSFPTILSDQNNTMEIARQMRDFELVILDDLGAERQSQYALEKVFYIIDERYKSGKPLIVTTNLSLDLMKKYRKGDTQSGSSFGEIQDYSRIYDRVLEMCVAMHFDKQSRREQPVRDKAKVMKEAFAER